jgi:hypothetical protein
MPIMPNMKKEELGTGPAGGLEKSRNTPASRWISYRPDIKVLDCTIRDGGLMNDHQFDDNLVKAVYQACAAAGIDYMEIGYKASRRLFA